MCIVFAVVASGAGLVYGLARPMAPVGFLHLATPSGGAPTLRTLANATASSNPNHYQCDGMYWHGNPTAYYAPSYCYGHDEPTMSFISNAPNSGTNAVYSLTLPASGPKYSQGDLYATFWFGGAVRDPNSTGGSGQGFLELQFYPSEPIFTGTGSGKQDCLPNGAFNPNQTVSGLFSQKWFSCAVVWQIGGVAGNTETAAFAGPMDIVGSSDSILEMASGDHVSVSFTGVAQSTTSGWHLTIDDLTSGVAAATTLQNGTLVLSPYFSTAAASNILTWGASQPGAIDFAYEIGHTLNASQPVSNASNECLPGDGFCDSYFPARWTQAGQLALQPPVQGTGTGAAFAPQIGFSSSEGGEAEINDSSCLAPSFSPLRNCMYPFFTYCAGSYSFTFDADLVANDTYDFGNQYQFPGSTGGSTPAVGFSQNKRILASPFGTVDAFVVPANASVEFNPVGSNLSLPVGPDGSATGQFWEGQYFLNASAPGCPSYSQTLYLKAGTIFSPVVNLQCPYLVAGARGSPNPVVAGSTTFFTAYVGGGSSPYSFSWKFGDGSSSTTENPTHAYASPGSYSVSLSVTSGGTTVSASTTVTVTPNFVFSPRSQVVHLYGENVSTSGNSLPFSFSMSSRFPTGQSDVNSGYLLPGPVSPTVWTFTANQTTAAPIDFDQGTLATAHFFLSLSTPLNGTGGSTVGVPATVVAQLNAGTTLIGTAAATESLPAGGGVAEFNLSFAPEVASVPAGSSLTLAFTWWMINAAGNAVSVGIALHSGATYPIGVDLPIFDPVLLSAPIVARGASSVGVSSVAVDPFGSYDLASVAATLNGAALPAASVTGSTYGWTISTLGLAAGKYTVDVTAIDLQGCSVSASGAFVIASTFTVSFAETGLAAGTSWSVTVNGATLHGSGSTLSTSLANGTYKFSVGNVAGYRASPATGSVSVAGGPVSVPIVFGVVTYSLSFTETGLAKGKLWSVTIGSVTRSLHAPSASGSSIVFAEPNGSYAFSVSSKGFTATPSIGTAHVSGSAAKVAVSFVKAGLAPRGAPTPGIARRP